MKSKCLGTVLQGTPKHLRCLHELETIPLGMHGNGYCMPFSIECYGTDLRVSRMIFSIIEYELLFRRRPHVNFIFYKNNVVDGMLYATYRDKVYTVNLYEVTV